MQSITVKLADKIVKHYPISGNSLTIGRARDNEIVIENLSVSRNHARILREGDKFVIVDLNSANGMFLNGVRVARGELTDGDIVSIGKHRLHFADPSAPRQGAPVVLPPEPVSSDKVEVPASATATDASVEEGELLIPDAASQAVVADVRRGKQAAVLVVTQGKQRGETFVLHDGENLIGRGTADVRLHDMDVGRRHAMLTLSDMGVVLKDLGSWKGTTLNGEKVREKILRPGDVLVLGGTTLEFNVGSKKKFAAEEAPSGYYGKLQELAHERVSVTAGQAVEGDRFTSGEFDMPQFTPDDEDEFAPMTDEELEAMEMEAEAAFEGTPAQSTSGTWRKLETARGGAGLMDPEVDLRRAEESSVRSPDAHDLAEDPNLATEDVHDMDGEEERSLFRGPVEDAEPGEPGRAAQVELPVGDETPLAVEGMRPVEPDLDDIPIPDGVDPKEVRRWSRGLKNRSKLVRREAARKLKELTGIDYDWESEPQ